MDYFARHVFCLKSQWLPSEWATSIASGRYAVTIKEVSMTHLFKGLVVNVIRREIFWLCSQVEEAWGQLGPINRFFGFLGVPESAVCVRKLTT